MAHIEAFINCEYFNNCEQCPYICPYEHIINSTECLACTTHCPCCQGSKYGFCNQCSEEHCSNRSKPYDPNSIKKEETFSSTTF